jgi:FO synthase
MSVPPRDEDGFAEPSAVDAERVRELLELPTDTLLTRAAARRDQAWGRALTWSPKAFIPLTNLCRNRCDYCAFRRSPGDVGEWTMTPDQVRAELDRAAAQGVVEALFCLGDKPESGFKPYKRLLASWGYDSTVDYLVDAAGWALERGLLPHTNAGILTADEMARLRPVNVSLGLMLENVSDRLCERDMPHWRAPDKRPARRIAMTREAGQLKIPFTSGLLIGIGETVQERVDTILAIRDLHAEHAHIQEVIVQNFRAHADTRMADAAEPDDDAIVRTVALARLLLPDEISVQAPPNLNPEATAGLVQAGINDFGGISPVTPDYINAEYPWPHVEKLRETCVELGFTLAPRLPVYDRYIAREGWVDRSLMTHLPRPVQARRAPPVSDDVRALLDGCLEGRSLTVEGAVRLFCVTGRDLIALCDAADVLRQEQAGDVVSYVVNRNVNFTNVCIKTCRFCAFSRELRSEQGYLLDADEVVRRVAEAHAFGATEVCLQAGLAPNARGRLYIELLEKVKTAVPDIHIHAYSPEEVKYGAGLARMPVRDYLTALKAAGLGSLPGTSAEILDTELRDRISPGRITVDEWVDVITTAHELEIPTSSTMMFGHVETPQHRARHMDLLRRLQRDTGGFTEFVPLSFVHAEAPMFLKDEVDGVKEGPTGNDVVRLYAIARLMLGDSFRNIQASWVKEGLRMSAWLLQCGVNDLGGTLINESISTSAGAQHGQLVRPRTLRRLIRNAGRTPAERNTRYDVLRTFDTDDEPVEPLDAVEDGDAVFGTYSALTKDDRFRYAPQRRRKP